MHATQLVGSCRFRCRCDVPLLMVGDDSQAASARRGWWARRVGRRTEPQFSGLPRPPVSEQELVMSSALLGFNHHDSPNNLNAASHGY